MNKDFDVSVACFYRVILHPSIWMGMKYITGLLRSTIYGCSLEQEHNKMTTEGGFNPDSAIQMFLVQFVRPISQSLLTDAPSNFCPIETAPEMFEFPVRPTVHTNSSRTRNALQTGGI